MMDDKLSKVLTTSHLEFPTHKSAVNSLGCTIWSLGEGPGEGRYVTPESMLWSMHLSHLLTFVSYASPYKGENKSTITTQIRETKSW